MDVEVASIVKEYLSSLSFIDKLAGLVKTVTKTDLDKDNRPVKKTFPVACGVDFAQCITNGKYTDLVPNSKIGCMVYLEDNGGVRLIGRNGKNYRFNASYRLVSWINSKKLGYENCSITAQMILSIISALPENPINEGIYQRLLVEVLGQDPKSYVPFSKYSYDEDKTQYLMHPFDYFSLPIEVTFEINPACAAEFIKQTEINCNN